jgi:hypothetical protein
VEMLEEIEENLCQTLTKKNSVLYL